MVHDPKDPKTTRVNVRLTEATKARLAKKAKRRRWSVSDYVRWLIDNHLKRAA